MYAAWSKNQQTRVSSTSGGIFYEFGKYVIDQGGAVAGSRFGEDWKSAHHMLALDMDGLLKVKGSKYFQSDTAGIYQAVRGAAETGKMVLFCGAPCQNAALASYLDKDYPNLYYMDFICRSINSPLAFRAYISELEASHGARAVRVHQKNKDLGWQSLATKVYFANGKDVLCQKHNDPWAKGFLHHDLYTRESCFQCPYRVLPRAAADITIGDFWGIKNQSEEDMFQGISIMLVNSEKGKRLLETVQEAFALQKRTIEDALPGNPALLRNPVRSDKLDRFFSLLASHPFSESVRKSIE